jgi:inner membrane protein
MNTENSSTTQPQMQLIIKSAFIFLLFLGLIIPQFMIEGLIHERQALQQNVESDISSSWGGPQTIIGPVLAIPYRLKELTAEKKAYFSEHIQYLSPESLQLKDSIDSDVRKYGIFSTVVYTSDCNFTLEFDLNILPQSADITYDYAKAALLTGISDQTAITQKISTTVENREYKAIPGISFEGFITKGFHVPMPIDATQKTIRIDQRFEMRGTTSMKFLPSGRHSDISMMTDWMDPSFFGRNLPAQKEDKGTSYTARWTANEYGRPFGDTWSDRDYQYQEHEQHGFGVKLIQTADNYQKNMRSVKYAILVISLSFMLFFFFEILFKVRIHPIQYLMVGLSLVVFYLLLLSITEHLGFNQAYLISSVAVIGLIAVYAQAILKRRSLVLMLCGLFTLLYVYIFVLLQLEDYALLAGSIGLFVILATVMFLSRKVDWYNLNAS